ncbi:MAG: sterol desaturase family protein [Bdellovibrionaceae bacterium]|nr:sterol desaturase family protein [Pseudobdellovibrionaceae bacterium]
MTPSVILYFTSKYFNYSPMYTDVSEYGWPYLIFTFFTLVVLVDTWFYWAHRLMHWHPFFEKAHQIHHESYNLNPLSAYSVDIVHGILNIIPYAAVILFMPWHPIALVSFGFFSLFYNGYIHLGYDLPQTWFQKYFPLRLIYTASHHAVHHHEYDHNFSAYFTFWDKLMKTEKLNNPEAGIKSE